MPYNRPSSLRPLLKRAEYSQFARSLNAKLKWNFATWEFVSSLFVQVAMPPMTLLVQVRDCDAIFSFCSVIIQYLFDGLSEMVAKASNENFS